MKVLTLLAAAATVLLSLDSVNAAATISPLLTKAAKDLENARSNNGILSFIVQLRKPDVPVVDRLQRRSADDWAEHGHDIYNILRSDAEKMGAPVIEILTRTSNQSRSPVQYFQQYTVSNSFVVDATYSIVEELAQLPEVISISPNFPFKVALPTPEFDRSATLVARQSTANPQWNIVNVNVTSLWSANFTGGGLRYGVGDTGVQWDHPNIRPSYAGVQEDGSVKHDYNWFDGVRRKLNGVAGNSRCGVASLVPCDDQGHGTHCTSSAVGQEGVGVAPGAKWTACRNMYAGDGRPEYYLNCLNFFLAPTDVNGNNPDPSLRPHAIGNSYGCPTSELCDQNTFDQALANLRAAGIFMSVSAGNSGPSCSTISDPPANEPNVCSVASITQSKTISGFSSRGPVAGRGRQGIDISAPGQGIRGAYPNNAYRSLSGTSMASPHVGGAVLVVSQACPSIARKPAAIQKLLQDTADPLFTTTSCGGDTPTSRPNNVFGWGALNVGRAVEACQKGLFDENAE
ncbi:hypothetical protein HDV05_005691 [Chytridiales sp. JEL 0842]|nr:hypothetical protein HDV05_005691 [Chytridiales sp. JEL 0842]